MDRSEKIMLVAIGLGFLALVGELLEVWPVFTAHAGEKWLPFALISLSALFIVLDLCLKARKSSPLRWREAFEVALGFLFTWMTALFLIQRIGRQ